MNSDDILIQLRGKIYFVLRGGGTSKDTRNRHAHQKHANRNRYNRNIDRRRRAILGNSSQEWFHSSSVTATVLR